MTTDAATTQLSPLLAGKHRGFIDRFGDRALYIITLLAALLSVAVVLGLAYKIIDEASIAFSTSGSASSRRATSIRSTSSSVPRSSSTAPW